MAPTTGTFLFDPCVVAFEDQRKNYQWMLWTFVLVPSLLVVIARRGSCFYPYSQLLFDRPPTPFQMNLPYAKKFLGCVISFLVLGISGIVLTIVALTPRCGCGSVEKCNVCRIQIGGLVDLGRCHTLTNYVGLGVVLVFVYYLWKVVRKLMRLSEYAPLWQDDDNGETGRPTGGEVAMV